MMVNTNTQYALIFLFCSLVVAGCVSSVPKRPTTDRCLALHTMGLPECSPPTSNARPGTPWPTRMTKSSPAPVPQKEMDGLLPKPTPTVNLFPTTDEFLDQLAQKTWNYLSSDWATSNHLPWSWRSESIAGGDYANTTEIGLLALSWLAAYDQQHAWSPDWPQTEAEVNAILDQLRAWQTGSQGQQPNGPNAYQNSVFYQWYWISSEPPVVSGNTPDHLVPAIDNAWLAVSLITIRAYAGTNGHATMAQKADDILTDMNFRLWYHADTHRFVWGDVENPQGGSPADYYSNENRIINFVARALGQLSAEEYQLSLESLERPSGAYNNIFVETLAWDGSYFTYTAPALFIRETETSYGQNSIQPATQAQIVYAQDEGYDGWGFSDCFDVGDGSYVQQGAPPAAAAGSPETRPGLASPHAAALSLITPLATEAITNLQTIAGTFDCAYDANYGFRDSVMTNPAAADYGRCSSRFSALAQEWIFLALVNTESGFVWNYFYGNAGVVTAHVEMFAETPLYLPVVIKSGDPVGSSTRFKD